MHDLPQACAQAELHAALPAAASRVFLSLQPLHSIAAARPSQSRGQAAMRRDSMRSDVPPHKSIPSRCSVWANAL